jgi:hypothetical protein
MKELKEKAWRGARYKKRQREKEATKHNFPAISIMQMSPRSLLLSYLGVKNRARTKKATAQNKLRSYCSLVGRVVRSPSTAVL